MITIYIDSDFKCHTSNSEGFQAIETDAFNGKCDKFIEGYRYVPSGKRWTRPDGVVFNGEMIAPFVDYRILSAYQEQYELNASELEQAQQDVADLQSQIADMDASYREGVNSV